MKKYLNSIEICCLRARVIMRKLHIKELESLIYAYRS
jgi:hypothetical protein